MVNSIIIICEDSPFGKNSAIESIRMATGILAIGDIENCKVIFLRDAIYFLIKELKPEALGIGSITNIMRLIELSDLEIFVHDKALESAGLKPSDLISYDNLKVVSTKEISQIILEADISFKY